jgi:hypothetical protein
MHAELAYVAMTRHENSLVIATSFSEFPDGEAMVRSLSRADEKSFSAAHELRPASERSKEKGYRHTLEQRRVEVSNAPRLRREEKNLMVAVQDYADALATKTKAERAGKPVSSREQVAILRTGAAVNHLDRTMRESIEHRVQRDNTAWLALVALSGEARAHEIVEEVRQARTKQESGQTVDLDEEKLQRLRARANRPHNRFVNAAAGKRKTLHREVQAEPGQSAGVSRGAPEASEVRAAVPRKRWAQMTPEEKQSRRNEYEVEQRRKAGVDDSREASKPTVNRSKNDYGLD